MGHRISARCLSYCHIATLAGRSQNTPTRVAHQHTCDSLDVHAHLRRMQHRSTLVMPANEGLHLCRIRRRYLDHDTLANWRPIPVVNLSETRCQHEPASPATLICVGLSCNCPALRLSRLAAGIISPGSFGRPYRFAHSDALEARAHWCSSRRGCFPAEPKARSHRSDAGNLLARPGCGYHPIFRAWLMMSVDLYYRPSFPGRARCKAHTSSRPEGKLHRSS